MVFSPGAYDDEEAAAHAYDLAALKYWGPETVLNFPVNSLMENKINPRFIYSLDQYRYMLIISSISN